MKTSGIIVGLFLLPVLFSAQLLCAQDKFEDMIRQQDDKFKQLRKDAQQELERLQTVDKEFAEILDRAWKELELSTGKKRDTKPKPDKIPVARPADVPEETPPEPQKDRAPEGTPQPESDIEKPEKEFLPEPEAKESEKDAAVKPIQETKPVTAVPAEPEKETPPVPQTTADTSKSIQFRDFQGVPVTFSFFGTPVQIRYDNRLKVPLTGTISEKAISSYWKKIGACDYENFLLQALQARKQLLLNDWGYCLFIDSISEGIYGGPSNARVLFNWFMLVKSGFDARVGFNEGDVFLLLPSEHTVYNTPYYDLDRKTYYITFLGNSVKSIQSLYTYEGNHKEAINSVDYNVYRTPDINKKIEPKKRTFTFRGNEFTVPVRYNKNVVDFFDDYPQTDLDVYFRASISPETAESLLEGLKPAIRGKSEGEAVNVLLRFVQTAFDYQTDDEQFGEEKPLFPEATLYYPYSDCEDRSFLFAFLTTRLLGLEVIGLHYPGHVATAVKFTSDVRGDAVKYNNTRYVVCDPTYINANYGECMPQFKETAPNVIPVTMN